MRFIPKGPLSARPATALPNALFQDEDTGVIYQYWNNSWRSLPTETIDPTNYVTFDDKATASKLGVMKTGDGLTASSGKVSLAAATASKLGGVKLVANQADSTAADVEGLVADFNTLLAALKTAGVMAPDPEPEGE